MSTATKAAPSQSAKPAAKPDAKAEKKPAKRIEHPTVGSKDTAVYPFETAPADFDGKKHFPFKKKDFKEEWQFFAWRLDIARKNVVKLERAMEEAKATGGSKDKAGAKRLVKMTQRLGDLQQKLAAKNVDVSAVLAGAGVDVNFLKTLLDAASKKA